MEFADLVHRSRDGRGLFSFLSDLYPNMNERPLSPHLQVYRLPLTAILSISHRATGVFLSFGAILWAWFLMSAAQGEAQYAAAQGWLDSFLGHLLLWAWIYSLFFHLCHGIRHLVWDTVNRFDRDTLLRDGYIELGASVALTFVVFLFSFGGS